MANRYAVATGNWNATATWSDSDGGAPGSTAPTASDVAYLTATSGAITVTLSAAAACSQLICTGYTGTLALSSYNLMVSGDITLGSAMTFTGTGALRYDAAGTITSNGKAIPNLTVLNSSTRTLADDLTVTGALYCSASATFAGAHDISCANFACDIASTITLVAGQKLNVSTRIGICPGVLSTTGAFEVCKLQSSSASTKTYIAYTGADKSTIHVAGAVFTDIDFSTYSTPVTSLDNWYGGTLTRTTGITNRTSADIGGGSAAGAYRCQQLGFGMA